MGKTSKNNKTAQLGIAAVIGSLSQFNTRSKRLVKVRTNNELFEGELTQIAWDIDHWIGMVDGEWFTLSEINCL